MEEEKYYQILDEYRSGVEFDLHLIYEPTEETV